MPDGSGGLGVDANPEDAKLVTLARGAKARVSSRHGAALRDETGRTYSGADVRLDSLNLSALELAVAQAVASGSRGVEAAVVVSDDPEAGVDIAAVAELGGSGVPVHVCATDGTLNRTITTGFPG